MKKFKPTAKMWERLLSPRSRELQRLALWSRRLGESMKRKEDKAFCDALRKVARRKS